MSDRDRTFANIGLTALAMAAAITVPGGAIAAGLAYTTVMTVGGLVLANNMAPPTPEAPKESPTYGWGVNDNVAREGDAIYVAYGEEQICPRNINQWIHVDNATGEQWIHNLYCCAIGTTNQVLTPDDILVGDQPLGILDDADYTIESTQGTQYQAVLTHHDKIHQMRKIGKELKEATLSQFLLHFDGDHGSTQIIDDGVGCADDPGMEGDTARLNKWTCRNTAALSTSPPAFAGNAHLDLTTDGDYVSCDEPQAFNIWARDAWDIEFRFRQDSLQNSCILGQKRSQPGGDTHFWGLFYRNGSLVFQQYRYDGSDYSVTFNVSVAVSLTAGTWHHIRVARDSAYANADTESGVRLYSATFYVFVDGSLVGSDSVTWPSPELPDAGDWTQSIGYGEYYNGSGVQALYGNCRLDEFRLYCYGHLYALEDFTPPVNPINDDGEQTFFTKGVIDSFAVIFSCPRGLYKISDEGEYFYTYVHAWISFRKIGSTDWHRKYVYIRAKTINPFSRLYDYDMPERGRYEIRVSELRAWSGWATGEGDPINPDDPQRQRTLYLQYIDERIHEQMTHPYLQLLSLSMKAQDRHHSQMPVTKVVLRRTYIEVPNYDGVGTKWAYPKSNPVVAYDMLTNRVYGAGEDPTRINAPEWDLWKLWCYGPVQGNPRCQVNMVFDKQQAFDEALQEVEFGGRAEIVFRGMEIGVVINKPAEITDLYVPYNIISGTQSNPVLRQDDRADLIEIVYRDANAGYTDKLAQAKCADYDTMTRKAVIKRISMPSCNNYDQARRQAEFLMQISRAATRASSLQTNIAGMVLTKGDVYGHCPGRVRSFTGRLTRGAGRETVYSGTTVYLDREITLDSTTFGSSCELYVKDPDGTVRQYTVSGAFDSAVRSVTVSASGSFYEYSPWAIVPTGELRLYRAEQPVFNAGKQVQITGILYDQRAYYHSKWGSDPI